MAAHFSRFSHWSAGVAMATVCALAECAAGEPTTQQIFSSRPNFEEAGRAAGARFLWRGFGTTVSLDTGGTLSIESRPGNEARITFLGSNARSEPLGEVPSPMKSIYYLGSAASWRTDSHFERVRYPTIYPGIDLVLVTVGDQLEFDFEIAPNSDPGAIQIHYSGGSLSRTRGGDLEMHVGNAAFRQRHPTAFQYIRGRKRIVRCDYRLRKGSVAELSLGVFDRSSALLIDPVLNFSTYLGGSSFDSINAAVSDSQGNLYVAGETSSGSLTNPTLLPRSSRDAFISKLTSAGTLVFTVYLGGSGYDSARGIALDPAGNIYVTGVTESSNFPVTTGSLLTLAPSTESAFVARLSPNFALQYSTYLGGATTNLGLAIAVDSSGAAYVAGQTSSTAFPVTSGAFETSYSGGASDCFVSKLNPAGNALAYSTLLGGNELDVCSGIAVDASGNAYVAGTTYSPNFPVAGALQSALLGTASAFVSKLNATGSALVYSTYIGGSVLDNATAISVDASGAAYVTGDTASIDFPMTTGVFQTQLNGQFNAFVCKLSAPGNSLLYSTLIGGSGSDTGTSISVDSTGRAVIGGYTTSSNFPTAGAVQAAFQGAFDAFSTVLDPAGATLVFSSYFGGSGDDRGYALALGSAGVLYLAGLTSSSNFPVADAVQTGLSVAPDAFVLKVTYTTGVPSAVSVTPNLGTVANQTFALQYSDTAGASSLQTVWVYINATLANPASNSCLLYYNVAANMINLAQNSGTAWVYGCTGGSHDIAEQPMLAECGGHDGDAEREQSDAHPSDDVFTSLCRGEEHLFVRGRCVGVQQRVATTRHLDGAREHPARRLCL